MKNIKKHTIESLFNYPTEIVTWDENYITGIELVDNQHKELVNITNSLFSACLDGKEKAAMVFKDTMSHMVDYVRLHFAVEQELMKRVNFPDYDDHKLQHDLFIKDIITSANEFHGGKTFAPNVFVRTLKDWVFSHIAYYDQSYASYVEDQKNRGLIMEKCIICSMSAGMKQF